MRVLGWTVSLLSFSSICWAQNQCYFPNGRQAADNSPCDPDAKDSACCGGSRGTVCLTNKLCRGPDGNIIRGSCTDKNWDSPECAQYCLSASAGGHDLISCSNVTSTDTSYCCDRQAFCCDNGVARFEVLPSNHQVWANWDEDASRFVVVQRTTTTSTSSSSTVSQTSASSATTLAITTKATTTTTTAAPSETTSAPDKPGQSSQPPSSESATPALPLGAQAGIGAGAGILVIALAAVAFLLWKLHKNKKAQQQQLAAEKQREQRERENLQHMSSGVYDPRYHAYKIDAGGAWYHSPAYGESGLEIGSGEAVPRQEMDGHGLGPRAELPGTLGRAV